MPRTAQPAKAALDNATRPLTKATKPKPKATHKLPFSADAFGAALHRWYRENARDLPWRGIDDPYATWLSEIMLQQTRVATVIERYKEFLRRFPTLQALADAREDDVLALWSGLGYYRRARMLHRGAQFVVRELEGKLPSKAVQLRTLPGVGFYTAAAIASISFGESVAVLDGNVERVLLRLLGQPEDRSTQVRTQLLDVAQQLVPAARSELDAADNQNPPGEHNQAMMELGATICLPRSPLCLHCPVFDFCKTRGSHVTEPRARLQSRNVAHLLATRKDKASTEVLLERRAATARCRRRSRARLSPAPRHHQHELQRRDLHREHRRKKIVARVVARSGPSQRQRPAMDTRIEARQPPAHRPRAQGAATL
jgi:A/G-specific adenine glycosylase